VIRLFVKRNCVIGAIIIDYALSGLEGEGGAFLSQGVAAVLMIYGFQP
jgi:hypothetical protein